MGIFADTFRALIPERKRAIAASVPTWQQGVEQMPPSSYDRNAREGYMLDEIVFDCVEIRASSVGEPPVCVYRMGDDEKLDKPGDHRALALLNRPNPFMGRSRFWATVDMCLDIGGNAYVEKVRSAAGRTVELWPLRPDRITVIPSEADFIGGYRYELGDRAWRIPAEDIIHFKTRHPLDDYYGLAPLAVLAGRVDLDVWQRRFTEAFFRNAGVPSGLLNIKRTLTQAEREQTRTGFRETYGGPGGWHRLLVIDSESATYTPMGLPLGATGLAMPDLNQINETRICGVYGVPTSLVPTIAGMNSNRGQTAAVSDRELFWESTMVPLFRDLDSTLTLGLADEFPDLERLEHDLSTVRALQEDEDKLHIRWRETFKASGCTWQEFRVKIGLPPEPEQAGIVLVGSTMVPTWSDEMQQEPDPMEVLPAAPGTPGANGTASVPVAAGANGRANGAAH